MDDAEKQEKLKDALIKCAVGYTATDETEEYVLREGTLELQKRKVVTREIPPELTAIKMLLATDKEEEPERLTEEQFIKERDRLLKILQNQQTAEEEP